MRIPGTSNLRHIPMNIRALIAAGIVILLAVASGFLWMLWRPNKQPVKPPQHPSAIANQATVSLSGKVQAQHSVNIAAPIEGRIESLDAEPGQEVSEGQVLAQIRSEALAGAEESAAAALESAGTRVSNLEAQLTSARLEASRTRATANRAADEFRRTEKMFDRQKMLLAAGATPRIVFEKAEREHSAARDEYQILEELAKAGESRVESLVREQDNAKKLLDQKLEERENAKAQLAAGEVKSPVGGIVTGRRGEVGDRVDPSMKDLFQIATDLSVLEIAADVDPHVAARLRAGQAALIHIAEMPGDALPGIVKKVEAGRAIVEFTSPTTAIKPGLTAQVTVGLT
jgi:HlyD family secretion protein